MMDKIQTMIMLFVLGVGCSILAKQVKASKQALLSKIEELVQRAEVEVQGTKMGEKKKAKVIAWLAASGVKATKAVEAAIEYVVDYLNSQSAWATSSAKSNATVVLQVAQDNLSEAVDKVVAAAGNSASVEVASTDESTEESDTDGSNSQ